MVRDNRHASVYLFGALCPARATGAAIVMPWVNSEAMSEHLRVIAKAVAPGAHAVLVCDGAGWHQRGERLTVPDNITLLSLPPYSPELNPMENVWDYLRGNKLSHMVWDIPCSPDNPEFLWVNDAKIVCDLVAPLMPVRRHFVAQEGQHRDTEFLEGRVAFVVCDVSVHQAP